MAHRTQRKHPQGKWLAFTCRFILVKTWQKPSWLRPKCEIQLPERIPANIGYLEYNGKSVSLRANAGQKINVNDKPVDFAVLQPDISDNPSFITLDDVRLVVIQRGNKTWRAHVG